MMRYRFIYKDQLQPVAKLDGDGNILEQYVYGETSHTPSYIMKNGTTYRVISDHLGSVRMVVDSDTGTVAQEISYDEFGNVLSDSNPGFQPFYYVGGVYDLDTGLVKFGARDYDPEVGRWTSKEPLGFNGASNFYVYAGNDPVNFVDVTGLAPGDPFKTVDAAAQDADSWLFSTEPHPDVEYASAIYEYSQYNSTTKVCETFYSYDELVPGGERYFLLVPPKNKKTVAIYHNHVIYKSLKHMSARGPYMDLPQSHFRNLIYYMGRENLDKIHKYTPISPIGKNAIPNNYKKNNYFGDYQLIDTVWK